MVEKDEEQLEPSARSQADMVERLIGLSRQHDAEDIEYWQRASDETRGRTLYGLLKMVDAIGHYPEKAERFPGFPKRSRGQHRE
ncbi:MAG: hypothetical protein HY331_14030 [Chloroflexi bacterium]|nr:hypothetical protein [Chloroflexota bacterium]